MFEVYEMRQLLKLPLTIECLTSYKDYLLVGTKQGNVLMYFVDQKSIKLYRSNKYFSKKPIVSLSAVSKYSILIALSDSLLSVHDIDLTVNNFPLISTIASSQGCHLFTTEGSYSDFRLLTALRKKLQFYFWRNRKFTELRPEIILSDTPKSLAWIQNKILIGFKSEYSLITLETNSTYSIKSLLTLERTQEPFVTSLSTNCFMVGKDETFTFFDREGNVRPMSCKWPEIPFQIVYDDPYILGITGKGLHVKTEEPTCHIQTIEQSNLKCISSSISGIVYIASSNVIWLLKTQVSPLDQIPKLVEAKEFSLAIKLCKSIQDEYPEEINKRIYRIQRAQALHYFISLQFKESFKLFQEVNIDPSHVIGLFPDLLPLEFRNQLKIPTDLPVLSEKDWENGVRELICYLTQFRCTFVLVKEPTFNTGFFPLIEDQSVIKSPQILMQIIDTTLLKCYLQFNNALVAPLLRLSDSYCHLEETERMLIKLEKYSELIIFYKSRGHHRKALECLKDLCERGFSELFGYNAILSYLSDLPGEYTDLLLEFSSPILKEHPKEGFDIFIDESPEVLTFDRLKIFEFISRTLNNEYILRYLEHVIFIWKDTNHIFHNALLLQYKNSNEKSKLKEFLATSKHYLADSLLIHFDDENFYEEKTFLLGVLGRHEEAIQLLLLKDESLVKTLEYCARHSKSTVYNTLILSLYRYLPSKGISRTSADKILFDFIGKVDLYTVLKSLPKDISLSLISSEIIKEIKNRLKLRHQTQITRGLIHTEHLQIQEQRIAIESLAVHLRETDLCFICHKRFSSSGAFVRFPFGKVVHYSCQDKV